MFPAAISCDKDTDYCWIYQRDSLGMLYQKVKADSSKHQKR